MSDVEPAIRLVIFDWAGTVIDFGSLAPVRMFVEVFKARGIKVSEEEVRMFMGMGKKEHIGKMLELPRIYAEWNRRYGPSTDVTVTELYALMLQQQGDILAAHCEPIPGALTAIETLRKEKILIGSTTGYGREAMAVVAPAAALHGFVPDDIVCVSDVSAGRPAPWMAQLSAQRLGVYPPWRCVKVDDTEAGVREGRNAGMWSLGVLLTGNEIGLSADALAALPSSELASRAAAARARLEAAGAHYVVDSIVEMPSVVSKLNERLAKGHRPDCTHKGSS